MASSTTKPIYRFMVFFRRRPDLTEEQFFDHWANVHGPMVAPWLLEYDIVNYTQCRLRSSLKPVVTKDASPDHSQGHSYDGVACFDVTNYERHLAGFKDPYYLDVIFKDEKNFIDWGQHVEGAESKQWPSAVPPLAFQALGECFPIIADRKVMVDVSPEMMSKFEEYQKKK